MYFVIYSTNKLELTKPGLNVWRVKRNPDASSYRILEIIVGGKRKDTDNISIIQSRFLLKDERGVIERIFNMELK